MKPTPFFSTVIALLRRSGRLSIKSGLLLLTLSVAGALVAGASHYLHTSQQVQFEETSSQAVAIGDVHAGWGAEALYAVQEHLEQVSPVALANACGLGASSCFRCHNGKRAPAPQSNAATAPWHQQHSSVNYSCVGCHQGNPRILKQDIAHKNLIVNPVASPEKTCAGCHSATDAPRLAEAYRKSHPHLIRGQ